MLVLLFILLLVGLVVSYLMSYKNVLSAWVIGHIMYLISVIILLFNYNLLKCDIQLDTLLIIMGSLVFIGAGELFVKNIYFRREKYYYPSEEELKPIAISKKYYVVSLLLMVILCIYDYYSFNYVGSYLGGSDFSSKYLLIRTVEVSASNGSDQDIPNVPLALPMAYLEFFIRILAYFYIYVYLYHKIFKLKNPYRNNWKNIIPIFLYLFICLFTLSRSIFINLIETFGIIYFIMLKQNKRQWNSNSSTRKIAKIGSGLLVGFMLIFSFVGTFKDSDVTEDVNGTLISYSAAGIYGLDEYMKGKYSKDSDYFGQNTLSNIYMFFNKFGFNFESPRYHNEPYVWGKHGEISNIASSPFYLLIDFPIPVVLLIYFIMGGIYSLMMNSIKFGKFKVKDFDGYVITAIIYYSIFMVAITDDFHHNISSVFVYYIICIYIIKYLFITKPKKQVQIV